MDILTRIRKVFRDSKKTQTEIGEAIDKTPQYIWKLLNNDNANPSKSVIKDICREFNVNEEWMQTGNGDPYRYDVDDDYTEISTLIGERDPRAKQAIIDYWNLSDDDKKLFWKFAERFLKGAGD